MPRKNAQHHINKCLTLFRENDNRTNRSLFSCINSTDNNFTFSQRNFDKIIPIQQQTVKDVKENLSQAVYIIEMIMALNSGITCYEINQDIIMGFDTKHQDPCEYRLNSFSIAKHDILRKAMLTYIGLSTYPNTLDQALLQQLRNFCLEINNCNANNLQLVNDTFRNYLITNVTHKLRIQSDKIEKFLLRCGEIGCAHKRLPNRIIRESGYQQNHLRTITTPLLPCHEDTQHIMTDNNKYLNLQKPSAIKNLLGGNVMYSNKVLTSQARKFLPHNLRNTYIVEVVNTQGNVSHRFVLTASPTPEIDSIDHIESTDKYYQRLIAAIKAKYHTDNIQINNQNIQLISLVSEKQPGKRHIGKAGNYAAQRANIKRDNYQVTYTKGRGMREATQNIITHQRMLNAISILHCESGVDRAGTLLEHVLYQICKSSTIVGGLSHGAFNAMLYNLQFGMKAKGIGFPMLERLASTRFQAALSDKNKKFMSLA